VAGGRQGRELGEGGGGGVDMGLKYKKKRDAVVDRSEAQCSWVLGATNQLPPRARANHAFQSGSPCFLIIHLMLLF